MMLPLMAAGTIDAVKWQHMPSLISRWIRQGVLNTALVLINFSFRTGLREMRYLFVFVLQNGQLKIAKL